MNIMIYRTRRGSVVSEIRFLDSYIFLLSVLYSSERDAGIIVSYLRVPKVSPEIVGSMSKLDCDDFVHFSGELCLCRVASEARKEW